MRMEGFCQSPALILAELQRTVKPLTVVSTTLSGGDSILPTMNDR